MGWRVTCAFRALGPMAKPAVPALIEFLQASEPEWIRSAPHEDVRIWAATGIGQFGNLSESVVPKLLEDLSSKRDSETRELNSLTQTLEAIGFCSLSGFGSGGYSFHE